MDDKGVSMNPPVDDEFLKAMGLEGLDEDQKQKALQDILYTLNINVGKRVSEELNETQLEEFDKLTDEPVDEDKLSIWIENNVPNYQELIEEEAKEMKEHALAVADEAMASKNNPEWCYNKKSLCFNWMTIY